MVARWKEILYFLFCFTFGLKGSAFTKNYTYHKNMLPYEDAKKFCKENDQDLARFDSRDEYKRIVKFLDDGSFNSEVLIGSNEQKWVDGSTVDLRVFGHRGNLPNCVTIKKIGNGRKLQNAQCTASFHFLCYKNGPTPDPKPGSSAFHELCAISPIICNTSQTSVFSYVPGATNHTKNPIAESKYASVLDIRSTQNIDIVFTTVNTTTVDPNGFLALPNPDMDMEHKPVKVSIPLLSLITIHTGKSVPVNYTIKVANGNVDLARVKQVSAHGVDVIRKARAECVYIDRTSNTFSTFGITTLNPEKKDFICVSNHSTIFAAMLIVDVVRIPLGVKVTSYVLEAVSMFSLALTFVILMLVRKKLRSTRTVVQMNLCVALFFLHFFIVIGEAALNVKTACEITSVVVYYFLLCAAMWMLLEGITLSRKTFNNSLNSGNPRKERNVKLAVGWILPAAMVTVFTLIGFLTGTYMDSNPELLDGLTDVNPYSQCWIKKNSWLLIAGVVLPLAIVLLANLLITIRVGMFVYEMSRKAEDFKPTADRLGAASNAVEANLVHAKASFRAVLMLLPVLGIPWIFMLIQVNHPVLMYANVILNGLQGFFILLIYCALSHDVKKSLMDLLNQRRLLEYMSSTSR